MSTNEKTTLSQNFWDWMQSYWHTNRDFPPAHPDWRKKADLVNGKVPAGQLPSYVDDVLEFSKYAELPQLGEKGKIYITTENNKQFRWSGSAYVEINAFSNLTPADYVTLDTVQNITGKKRFDTAYNSYTADGLFDPNAKPLSTNTPGGKNLLFGYKDYGSGQYYPRIGFTSDTNWSLGTIGNNFTIGTNNDGSAVLNLTSSGKLLINNSEVYSTDNFNPEYKAERENNAVGIGFYGGQLTMPFIRHNYGISYLFSAKPMEFFGSEKNANDIERSGFYAVGNGTLGTGNYSGSKNGKRALLHFETENIYSASQIQTERYTGNILSRTRTDGFWSDWIKHWGSNDFTADNIEKWNNSIDKSSALEEVILEDDVLKIQPDEFSLEGNGSYDANSKKNLVHVLFKDGTDVNIRELVKRQTIVVFNLSRFSVNLNVVGLKSYSLSPEMQISLYITDEMEVLLYNETRFKKM